MRLKSLLLGSASVLAAGAASAQHAAVAAGVTVPDSFLYSVEGAWLTGRNTVAEDKLGSAGSSGGSSFLNISPTTTYRGAITLGTRIDPNWDFKGGIAVNNQTDSHSSGFFSGAGGGSGSGGGSSFFETINTNFSFQTVDFEAGYTPTLDGNFNVRLFAGIRGLHFTDTSDKMGFSGGPFGSSFHFTHHEEFVGAGPRVGLEASSKLGDGPFGLSGMVAGSLLVGHSTTQETAQFSSGGSSFPVLPDGFSEWKTVYDIEGALGIDYWLTGNSKFTVGVRAEQVGNVGGSGGSGGTTRTSAGLFAKLSGSL